MLGHQPYDDLAHHNSHNHHHFGVEVPALLMQAFGPTPDQSRFLEPLVAADNYHILEVDTVNSAIDMAPVADNRTQLAVQHEDLGIPIVAVQVHVDDTPAADYNRQREETALQANQIKNKMRGKKKKRNCSLFYSI